VEKAPDAFRTISEVADDLDVPQHVLRFWESRFREIKPMKRGGGRRYYRPDDVDLLRGIRHLLYGEGYTIRGVQRILRDQNARFVQAVWRPGSPKPAHGPSDDADSDQARRPESGEMDRGRGLFGLLPSLLGNEDSDMSDQPAPRRAEPPLDRSESPRSMRPSPARGASMPAADGLPREDLRKLQAALHELSECRKLIDEAINAPA